MARQYLDDVRMAISDVQYLQEKLNRSEEKGDKITIKALYLALAGMSDQLSREQNNQFGHILNSPFAEVGHGAAACSIMPCRLLPPRRCIACCPAVTAVLVPAAQHVPRQATLHVHAHAGMLGTMWHMCRGS
jgi:hypothetical protein